MTDHIIVVCQNDYPSCVLPAGTTQEQATKFCRQRSEVYEAEQRKQGNQNRKTYFHWHEVPVEKLP